MCGGTQLFARLVREIDGGMLTVMDDDDIDTWLVAEARRRLGEGAAPSQVFAQLAEGASDGREVALAVCIAVGIPRVEAEQRLGSKDPEDWKLDGDEHMSRGEYASEFGDLLERVGTFDLPVELSADQRRIVAVFEAAISEFDGVRSGAWLGYFLAVRQGRLHEAFVMLARPERIRRDVDTKTYWGRLVEAAEMLGSSDGGAEYVDAVQRCRDRLARSR
jgi:hypothetical protein